MSDEVKFSSDKLIALTQSELDILTGYFCHRQVKRLQEPTTPTFQQFSA
jgi:hypothetical protein